jgi:hypothetical protein
MEESFETEDLKQCSLIDSFWFLDF